MPISINSELHFIKSLQKTLCIEYIYLFISIKIHIFILYTYFFFKDFSSNHNWIFGDFDDNCGKNISFRKFNLSKNPSKCFIQLNLEIMFINYVVFLFFLSLTSY